VNSVLDTHMRTYPETWRGHHSNAARCWCYARSLSRPTNMHAFPSPATRDTHGVYRPLLRSQHGSEISPGTCPFKTSSWRIGGWQPKCLERKTFVARNSLIGQHTAPSRCTAEDGESILSVFKALVVRRRRSPRRCDTVQMFLVFRRG